MTVATAPPIITLPTQDQLPCDDGIPMETQRHKMQMDLLIDVLTPWIANREDGYVSGNMFIYFSTEQLRNQDFRGPDFFVVLGVPKNERKSWVVWEEGKGPDLVIELLSESTAKADKTEKKLIYQHQLRVPEYFYYDPFNPEDLAGFSLKGGVYYPLEFNQQGWLISDCLQLALVRWYGVYREVETVWLRWATLEGELLPTSQELAQQAQEKAQQAELKAQQAQLEAQQAELKAQQAQMEAQQAELKVEQAEEKAAKLAQKLRELGIDPEQLFQV